MKFPTKEVVKHLWRVAVGVVKCRWAVLMMFGALWLPVDVRAFSPLSRVLIGACLVVGFVVAVVINVCWQRRAGSEQLAPEPEGWT